MTDQVQDQATEQTEAAGSPTPKFSDVSQGVNSKAQTDVGLAKQIAELNKRLADQDAQIRAIQSGKDKSNDRRDRELEALKQKLTPEARAELDQAVAARDHSRDEIRAVLSEMQPSNATVPGRTLETEYLDQAREILDDPDIGLTQEEKDAVYAKVAKKQFTSVASAIKELGKQMVVIKGTSQPASLAGVIAPTGGSPKPQDLEKKYKDEIIAARGKGSSVGREIRRKYEAMGLDVLKVSFP